MKKVALVLGLIALTLYSRGKHDSHTHPKEFQSVAVANDKFSSIDSQKENSLVQLHGAGMSKITFGVLRETIGSIDIGRYTVDDKSEIILINSFSHNVKVKGYNKMIDNFNSLYDTNNETLMKTYQGYADENCKKIYGCVGTVSNTDYDWKIIKFLPNPEKCIAEPTITMSNVMLYK